MAARLCGLLNFLRRAIQIDLIDNGSGIYMCIRYAFHRAFLFLLLPSAY